MRIARVLLCLAVALLIASPLLAAPKGERTKGERGRFAGMMVNARFIETVKGLEGLEEAQKTALGEIETKVKALDEERGKVFSKERTDARDAARKAATDAGKDRRAAFQAGQEALKATPEETAKLAELGKQGQAIYDEVVKLLTPPQNEALRAKLRALRPPRPAAPPAAKSEK